MRDYAELLKGEKEGSMRLRTLNTLLGLLTLSLGLNRTAPAQSTTVFDAPNALAMESTNINASGEITGWFYDASQSKYRGFVRDQNGNITVFDAPNAAGTSSGSINARGDVTGSFSDASQNNKTRGFVRDRKGSITVFDAPDESGAGEFQGTFPVSINAGGDVAGFFSDASQGNDRGFVRDRKGNITVFDAPDASGPTPRGTAAMSINGRGDVTGEFSDASQGGNARGFVRDGDGNITVFDAPIASPLPGTGTLPQSINHGGDITGRFVDAYRGRSFVRHRDGNITVFDAPNASDTEAFSINGRGDVTGEFSDATQGGKARGFVRDRKGNITVFDAPNASGTTSLSINARGDVTGVFIDASQGGKVRGFVRSANPRTPRSINGD
jgi:hypothetical protein